MNRFLLAALLLSPIAANAADLTVSQAFSRATPGTAAPGVAYFTIHGGDVADRLIGVSSPRANEVQMHTMTMQGDMMRMRQVDGIDVPAGGTVTLAPGGLHLMLEELKAPLKQGETVPLVLTFQHAGERRIEAAVGTLGATAPVAK